LSDLLAGQDAVGAECRLGSRSPLRMQLRPLATCTDYTDPKSDVSGHPEWPRVEGRYDARFSKSLTKHCRQLWRRQLGAGTGPAAWRARLDVRPDINIYTVGLTGSERCFAERYALGRIDDWGTLYDHAPHYVRENVPRCTRCVGRMWEHRGHWVWGCPGAHNRAQDTRGAHVRTTRAHLGTWVDKIQPHEWVILGAGVMPKRMTQLCRSGGSGGTLRHATVTARLSYLLVRGVRLAKEMWRLRQRDVRMVHPESEVGRQWAALVAAAALAGAARQQGVRRQDPPEEPPGGEDGLSEEEEPAGDGVAAQMCACCAKETAAPLSECANCGMWTCCGTPDLCRPCRE
jgi:hypothetical protein